MKRTFLALSLLLPALALALPAKAQQAPRCAPRAEVLDLLEKRYSETLRAIGMTRGQAVMELYASDDDGSWTLLMTLPNGLACMMGAGTAFEALVAPVKGSPT